MTPTRTLPTLVLAVVCALTGAGAVGSQLSAQTVSGTVREAGSGRPLPAAWVELIDATGSRVVATLAGSDGAFVLEASLPGVFRLQTRALGYDGATSDPFELAPGIHLQRDVMASVRVVQLDGIAATTSKACGSLEAAGAGLVTVWDEARTALEISAWTAETEALVFDVVEYERTLHPATLEVRDSREEVKKAAHRGSPYVSVPSDTLLKYGYVRRSWNRNRTWVYWAPDAEILLSEAFLENHCFDFHPDSDPERLGLRFEPIDGLNRSDIAGVLWLDRASSELRTLEFTYVNLPADHPASPHVGGDIEFQHLATGGWIVNDWRIRIPNVVLKLRAAGVRREVASINEQGARVLGVETAEGESLAAAAGATLTGAVRVEATERPLAGAVIEILSTEHGATAGASGDYRITGLPTGTFGVRVSHPWLDALDLDPIRRSVTLRDGITSLLSVDLDVSVEVDRFCPRLPNPRVLYGTIRDQSSKEPFGLATVRVQEDEGREADLVGPSGQWAVCVDAGLDSATIVVLSPDSVERARTRAAITDDPLIEITLDADQAKFVPVLAPPEPEEADSVPAESVAGDVAAAVVPVQLEGVEVNVAADRVRRNLTANGFYRRASEGFGDFITPEEIEQIGIVFNFSDLLRSVPGVSTYGSLVVFRSRSGGGGLVRVRDADGNGDPDLEPLFVCEPRIWIDGALQTRASKPMPPLPSDLRALVGPGARALEDGDLAMGPDSYLAALDIVAIEVYRRASSMPLEWGGGGSQCGAIVIWTERGGG